MSHGSVSLSQTHAHLTLIVQNVKPLLPIPIINQYPCTRLLTKSRETATNPAITHPDGGAVDVLIVVRVAAFEVASPSMHHTDVGESGLGVQHHAAGDDVTRALDVS